MRNGLSWARAAGAAAKRRNRTTAMKVREIVLSVIGADSTFQYLRFTGHSNQARLARSAGERHASAFSMLANSRDDLKRQLKGAAAFFAADANLATSDGGEEGFDFQPQRFAAFDRQQSRVEGHLAVAARLDRHGCSFLRRIIDRDVFVRLKETHLADFL